jgi:hypothetical protein
MECTKDTGVLLASAFLPRLNTALKRIIKCERDGNRKLSSDGTLKVHKKLQGAEGDADRGAEGDADPCFHATLERTERSCPLDTLEIDVPIHVFMTGGLAFCATVLDKEGMDKAHCMWCELKKAEWQADWHERGVEWTPQELKQVARVLSTVARQRTE